MRHCEKNSCWWQIHRREISLSFFLTPRHTNTELKRELNRLLLAVSDVVGISETLELACQIYRDCECAAWCFSDHNREEHLSVNSNFKAGICPLWLILFHDLTLLFPTSFFSLLSARWFYLSTVPIVLLSSHLAYFLTYALMAQSSSISIAPTSSVYFLELLEESSCIYLESLIYYHAINYFS